MSKNIFLKIITLILILSTFALPFFEVAKVYAQQSGGYTTGGSYEFASSNSGITGGIGGYISLITPAIQELPLCKEKISNSALKGLFRDSAFALKVGGKTKDFANQTTKSLGSLEFEGIPVYDAAQLEEEKKQTAEQEEVKKSVSALEENDSCLKSIGRMVVKLLLQKITFSTVEWINRGFEGKPLFLEDPGAFFKDIATNELLQFRAEINDPTLYPFARNFLRGQINSINRRFADNARYSANELISQTTPNYTAFTFQTDFQLGGWNAWDAITQVPANNPIGFRIIATNELSARLEGTSQNEAQRKQNDLNQSGGFLGVERCVANPEITKAEHRAALEKGEREKKREWVTVGETAESPGTATLVEIEDPNGEIIGTCPGNKWEYVTPGKAASEALTKVLNYPDNNLLNADDLNAAIATILDAALNRFVPDLLNNGFKNISTEGRDGAFVYDDNGRTTGAYGQVYIDFPASAIRSSWLRENSDFNIRTDLTQAVIDEQRIYQRKLLEQNEVLKDLITTVHQLDYCIPGPNPDYIETGERVLAAVKNSIPAKTAADFNDIKMDQIAGMVKTAGYVAGTAIGASIGTAVFPGFGTIIGAAIGALAGLIGDLIGSGEEEKVDRYYAGIFGVLTGVHLSKKGTEEAKLTGKQDITLPLDVMFDRYTKMIKKYYTPDFLPTITPTARIEFRKIAGYEKTIENNEFAASQLEGIIVRLAKLKDNLDALDPNVASYNDYLPYINEFARLSGSMFTGNDIAKVFDDTKEYSSHIKYVYDDLLTGPFGCEKDLMDQRQTPTSADAGTDKRFKLRQTKRTEYPFRLWYDYNKLDPKADIPNVPELEKYKTGENIADTKMPEYVIGPLGPGFLSSVQFSYTTGNSTGWNPGSNSQFDYGPGYSTKNCPTDSRYEPNILDCIDVSDLFISVNSWPVSVGRNQGNALSGESDQVNRQKDTSFEQTIGVY